MLSVQERESHIITFETKYDIKLPESYRDFYINNGNFDVGGIPYPLYTLDKGLDGWLFYSDDEEVKELLHAPCQIYPKMGEKLWEEWIAYGFLEPDEIDEEIYKQHNLRVFGGMLPIGTEGCTISIALILNGKYRGQVAWFDADYPQGYPAILGDFADWYKEQCNKPKVNLLF